MENETKKPSANGSTINRNTEKKVKKKKTSWRYFYVTLDKFGNMEGPKEIRGSVMPKDYMTKSWVKYKYFKTIQGAQQYIAETKLRKAKRAERKAQRDATLSDNSQTCNLQYFTLLNEMQKVIGTDTTEDKKFNEYYESNCLNCKYMNGVCQFPGQKPKTIDQYIEENDNGNKD